MKALFTIVALYLAGVSQAHAQPKEPPRCVVLIKAHTSDGDISRMGVVINKRVATTLGWMDGATDVKVISADGKSHTSDGVASYNLHSNVALISVNWGDDVPTAAELAPSSNTDTADSVVAVPDTGPDHVCKLITVITTKGKSYWFWVEPSTRAKISHDWGGTPVFDAVGKLTGIVSGGQPGDTVRGESEAYATRVEVVRSLAEVPLIAWKDWPSALEKFTKSDVLSHESAAVAREGHLEEAAAKAKESVELDPRNAYGWQMVAAVHARANEDEAAIDACKKAMEISPCDTYPYVTIAGASVRLGRLNEALEMANKAVALDPKDFRCHSIKGHVLEHDEQFDEALASYREALRLNPRDSYSKDAVERLQEVKSPDPKAPKKRSKF